MTREDERRLAQIVQQNREHYLEQVRGLEPCDWDYCVLTASTQRQARGYELELERRQHCGWLPPGVRYLVVPDLGGRRIGSGGAACYALRQVMRHLDRGQSSRLGGMTVPLQWDALRILLINSGGDSKRIPHCSAFGKVFAGLPWELFPGGPRSTLFDELMVALCRLPERLEGGVVVLSGDVLLAFDPVQLAVGPGVSGLGFPCPWAQATGHGVYVCSPEGGPVQGFLQKPSYDEMLQAGALHQGQAFVDSGLLAFDAKATRRLAALAGATLSSGVAHFEPGVLEQPGTEQAQIDLYREVCLTLAGHPPTDARETVTLDDCPRSRWVRERVIEAIADLEFRVSIPRPAEGKPSASSGAFALRFLHLGTSKQWRDLCTGRTKQARTVGRPIPAVCVHGSAVGKLRTEGPAVVEYCRLPWCKVGAGAILSGVEQEEGLVLAEQLVLHQLPLVSGAGERVGWASKPVRHSSEGAKAGPTQRWVVQLYGVEDDAKAPLESTEATFCGTKMKKWLAQRGLAPEVLWPHVAPEERCLWTARLFVPGDRSASLRWALWLAGLPEDDKALQQWTELERISLEECLEQADQEAIHRHRARLTLLPSGGQSSRRGGMTVPDPGLIRYLQSEADPLRRARACKILADSVAEARGTVIPPGRDDCPPSTGELLDVFAGRKFRTPSEASDWLEEFAFEEVGRAVAAGLAQYPAPEVLELSVGRQVTVRAPGRIDFGGGWSDTPPFSLEHGGAVLNAAVLLDGKRPIAAHGEVLAEPVIELISTDGQTRETIADAAGLGRYRQPGDCLSLHRAAIILAGLAKPEGDLPSQLRRAGGGVRLETDIRLPHGSGLGTSSIAALALLRCLDLLLDRESSIEELSARVLCLEQMLTTGGGWQDQLGGGTPGIKLLETEPGVSQRPRISCVQLSAPVAEELRQRLLVCFTGERRVAKNILREIMGRYLSRAPEVVKVLHQIKQIARDMKCALEKGALDEFGRLMAWHWELNKTMDARSTTAHTEQLFAEMGDLIAGGKMAGAGGGGFMEIVARDAEAARTIRQRLRPLLASRGGRFYEVAIDPLGVVHEAEALRMIA